MAIEGGFKFVLSFFCKGVVIQELPLLASAAILGSVKPPFRATMDGVWSLLTDEPVLT